MANPFTEPTLSGYNTSPPPDDASTTEANRVKWATHISKIGDPLKTWVQSVLTNITTAFTKVFLGGGIVSLGGNHTVQTTDRGKLLRFTATATVTMLDPATATSTFNVTIKNDGTGTVTVNDDLAALVATLEAGESVIMTTDGSSWRAAVVFSTALVQEGVNRQTFFRGYIDGLALSNNATDALKDVDIAPGVARDAANTDFLEVTSAIGKQLDGSWATGGTPGTPTGGLSSSLTLTASTTYHAILGKVSDTVEVGFDTSITGANLVTDHSFTNTRRIGSVLVDGSTNVVAFRQDGDRFTRDAPVQSFSEQPPSTAAQLKTVDVPSGIKVEAVLAIQLEDTTAAANTSALITDPDITDTAPSLNLFTFSVDIQQAGGRNAAGVYDQFMTDTSAQVRYRVDATTVDHTISCVTHGWLDRRGRG